MVGQKQLKGGFCEWPLTPFAARFQRNQALVSQGNQAGSETKFVIEVNRQCYQNVFRDCEPVFQRT
ncbi:hypothetical protein J2W28_001436 [Variovorax boronicumulans]|uniref:hypothetical protein n=1 Tax=Variovorax boronicumulans TaxID=436515 RepID=UPI00278B8D26|nr:hypothetical protein [Variovorax boronicumulans]MDP9992532.1 hypothetical protein [Variovorax boronicumulans]MDQ0002296.1 hypothetical protein [Variovorax boronicumulans]MDQ0042048.1 hypothetical protein [Variovorax boronicumulans]